ncbi:MAG TPA: WG repeat-containing protein, partial [Blastocatellia bacterium]|nr:WG repeat-containing protein [Blastocatellia bacterium]
AYEGAADFSQGLAAVEIDGKWGYIDTRGRIVIKPRFTQASSFADGQACVAMNGRIGFINRSGRMLHQFEGFEICPKVIEGLIVTKSGVHGWGYINQRGEMAVPPRFRGGQVFSDGLAAIEVESEDPTNDLIPPKWGYINKTGKIVIEPRFTRAFPFQDGLAYVEMGDDVSGYIDKTGRLVTRTSFAGDRADSGTTHEFSEGLAAVESNGFVGFIDRTGAMVIEPQFLSAGDFSDGLAPVRFARSLGTTGWGYIDRSGKTVIPPQFAEAEPFSDGLALIGVAGKPEVIDKSGSVAMSITLGYIDKSGKIVIAPKYSRANDFSEGLAAVGLDSGWGYIDHQGQMVIEPNFASARPFSNGVAGVERGNEWGFIDKTGAFVIPMRFKGNDFVQDTSYVFSEGLASVEVDDSKWAYADRAGRLVIKPGYDEAMDFSEGIAAVRKDGKWGFIDKAGNTLISPQFDWVHSFGEGLASVDKDGKFSYIDRDAHVAIRLADNVFEAFPFSEGLARVMISGKIAYIDKTGKTVIQTDAEGWYGYAGGGGGDFHDGLAAIRIGGKWGFINRAGKVVVPCQFLQVGEFSRGVAWVTEEAEGEKFWRLGYVDIGGRLIWKPQN